MRDAQLLHGKEPLHCALEVVLVSLLTNKAIVAVVLACEIPCGGARYLGSGLSKYDTGKLIIGKLSEFIGIYRNFDGKLLYSYFTTVSEVFWSYSNSSFAAVSELFWELIAPNLMILLLFR